MINFFKKKTMDETDNNESYSKIASLLIHAAKIDQNFEEKEKEIIKKTLIDLGANNLYIDKLILNATIVEEDSNQILDFTREIKNIDETDKIKIIESLWKIIYSDGNADIYEANLMRRLAGLLYIDDKTMGELKVKIKAKLKK